MKTVAPFLVVLGLALAYAAPQNPNQEGHKSSGQNPKYHHDDTATVEGSRGSRVNAAGAQGSSASSFKEKDAQVQKGKASEAEAVKATSKGTSEKKGVRWGEREAYGEAWDNKASWDDTVVAARKKEGEGAKGQVHQREGAKASQGSAGRVNAEEYETVKGEGTHHEEKN